MPNQLIYGYCLSNSSPELNTNSDTEELISLRYGDFYAVVKYVSESEFSEKNFKMNLSDIQWLETNARNHIGVINRLMENNTVIPFKFGTIFQAEASLQKFITDYSGSLAENFDQIRGKEEWTIKIFCNRVALIEKIDDLSEEAANLEKQIMESSPGRAYLLKRKKADLIEMEIDRICKCFGQECFDEFNRLSDSTNLNNLLPKEFTGREDTMILNATFLLNKDKVAEFQQIAATIREKDRNSGFFIEITGPWPTFSFISIKEKQ